MTNSNFGDIVVLLMFATRFMREFMREKRIRGPRIHPAERGMDVVREQVKKVLQDTDQKLILMVRG